MVESPRSTSSSGGMGMHFVNSTSRPFLASGDHALSVVDVEAAFDRKFAAAVAARSASEAFLDFSYVLYSMELGQYIAAFQRDSSAGGSKRVQPSPGRRSIFIAARRSIDGSLVSGGERSS